MPVNVVLLKEKKTGSTAYMLKLSVDSYLLSIASFKNKEMPYSFWIPGCQLQQCLCHVPASFCHIYTGFYNKAIHIMLLSTVSLITYSYAYK